MPDNLHSKGVPRYTEKEYFVTQQKSALLHSKRVLCYTAKEYFATQQRSALLHSKRVLCYTAKVYFATQQMSTLLHSKRVLCYTAKENFTTHETNERWCIALNRYWNDVQNVKADQWWLKVVLSAWTWTDHYQLSRKSNPVLTTESRLASTWKTKQKHDFLNMHNQIQPNDL